MIYFNFISWLEHYIMNLLLNDYFSIYLLVDDILPIKYQTFYSCLFLFLLKLVNLFLL